MIVDRAKFLNLVCQEKISCSTKSYSDTLLFYYLGYLAAQQFGDLLEIGVGGSTYALTELSELTQKTFYVVDQSIERSAIYAANEHWPDAKLTTILDDSRNLHQRTNISALAYCHVDGDKDYEITKSDLEFCLNHLAVNGIICQDDYGNNKWPTVTDVIKELEYNNKIKFVLVGDSSVWITRPEYLDHWMNLLKNDYEFSLLSALCNVGSSTHLSKYPEYLILQSAYNKSIITDYNVDEQDYFDKLLSWSNSSYLKMPYPKQSTPGTMMQYNIHSGYRLTTIYNDIRGQTWPEQVPVSKEDIESLPDWVKDELKNIHNIDIFDRMVTVPEGVR